MTPFLKIVAEDIYNRFNGKLEDVAVVFPNKRASLFFSEYLLAKNNGNAMWSPRYMTIGELFHPFTFSSVKANSKTSLISFT